MAEMYLKSVCDICICDIYTEEEQEEEEE